jgi:hypothetical protein
MTDISPKIPVDFNVLKDAVRHGLGNPASRYYWWPNLPNVNPTGMIDNYPELGAVAEQLSAELADEMETKEEKSHKTKQKNDHLLATSDSIMQVLLRTKLLSDDEVPNFEVILKIIVFIIRRPDVSCILAGDLLTNRDRWDHTYDCQYSPSFMYRDIYRYVDPSPEPYALLLRDFREVLQNFSPKTFSVLYGIGALEDRFLDLMFRDFFIELLPPEVVLRVVDAFLLEGNRILFRYGLAIIRGYKASIKANAYPTATAFWHAVKADATNAATKATDSMLFKNFEREESLPVVDAFVLFSKAKNPAFLETTMVREYPFDIDRSLFKKMVRPMSLSTKRQSFAIGSPANAVNSNSAGIASNSDSQKGGSRRASVNGLVARHSISGIFADSPGGSPQTTSHKSSGPPIPVLARRHSATSGMSEKGMSGKALMRSRSHSRTNTGEFGAFAAGSASASASASAAGSPVPDGALKAPSYTSPATSTSAINTPASSAKTPVFGGFGGSLSSHGRSMDADEAASSMGFSSTILTAATAGSLLRALAFPIPLGGYHLAFSSTQQGYYLNNLYNAVGTNRPLLLLVQLKEPLEHIVLGAYMNVPLEPTERCKGNQHTTCFRIDSTQGVEIYRWAGEGSLQQSSEANAARMQFIHAAGNMLSFGASAEHGTHALRLDATLHWLNTGPSDTYGNNTPLVHGGRDASFGQGFKIKEVEVFSALPTTSTVTSGKSGASRVFADIAAN